jgi:hypothetical protein
VLILNNAGMSRNQAAHSIAGIDHVSVCVDVAEPQEFLDRADGGRAVEVFGGDLDQPVHRELRNRRRLQPHDLVARAVQFARQTPSWRAAQTRQDGKGSRPGVCARTSFGWNFVRRSFAG